MRDYEQNMCSLVGSERCRDWRNEKTFYELCSTLVNRSCTQKTGGIDFSQDGCELQRPIAMSAPIHKLPKVNILQ